MNTTIHNEFKKYKDLRFIAKHIALGFKDELDSEELTETGHVAEHPKVRHYINTLTF